MAALEESFKSDPSSPEALLYKLCRRLLGKEMDSKGMIMIIRRKQFIGTSHYWLHADTLSLVFASLILQLNSSLTSICYGYGFLSFRQVDRIIQPLPIRCQVVGKVCIEHLSSRAMSIFHFWHDSTELYSPSPMNFPLLLADFLLSSLFFFFFFGNCWLAFKLWSASVHCISVFMVLNLKKFAQFSFPNTHQMHKYCEGVWCHFA